ncbi:hypothetical protein HAN_2g277 (nucleomorph) [Hemiselmis andersenii]|uniref:Uncharacterized protein n=1 Tax=Hemiselmis andersenii TaxID=464988 RepID=A9BKU4_HEMAN|nr:hypothetical protein HAN_2g277 [Hemiselmis andersenii]ABW98099.1 hypothetical protein HAN_2g277 [Hemiselmis andersenii]
MKKLIPYTDLFIYLFFFEIFWLIRKLNFIFISMGSFFEKISS